MVSETEKEDRRARLMELQRGIALARHREMVGNVVPVLVDGAAEESELLTAGRTEGQAPDVDARVLIVDGAAPVGRFVDVEITKAHPEDLIEGGAAETARVAGNASSLVGHALEGGAAETVRVAGNAGAATA